MALFLQTMGDLRLADEGGKPLAFPEKGLLILAYLLLQPSGEITRRRMSRLLWQDSPSDSALANLRQTIFRIVSRQDEIGVRVLSLTRQTISLNRGHIGCDFLVIYDRQGERPPFVDLRAVLAAFTGAFLENIDVPPGEFSVWRNIQRQRSLTRLSGAIARAAELARTDDDKALIEDASARLFQHAPGDAMAQLFRRSSDTDTSIDALRYVFELTGVDQSNTAPPAVRAARHIFDARHELKAAPDGKRQPEISQNPLPRIALLPPGTQPPGIGAMIGQALVEDITIALTASRDLQVVAPYTAAKIGLSSDKPALFEKHRISYVMDTRLSSDGEQPCLFVQLVQFANDEVIWAERILLDEETLAVRRGDLAGRLSATVSDHVCRAERTREYFEKSPGAYYHFLLGQRYLSHLTLPDLRRARREFKSALAQANDFAPAMSGIARTLSKEWLLTARGDRELLSAAEENARNAIRLGQDLPSGYRELGVARLLGGAIDESVEALSLAETMSPHYADVIADFADTLVHAALPERALEKIKFAITLNPISPDPYLWTAAGASYCLSEYNNAIGYINQMQDNELATRLAAASWAMLGNARRARKLVAKARETHPDFDVERWLSVVPMRDQRQKDHYREGLRKAGF